MMEKRICAVRTVVMAMVILCLIGQVCGRKRHYFFYTTTTAPPPTLTCWTCPNKTDNEACNRWAPDVHCPMNHTVCKTVHRFNTLTGVSHSVNKFCTLSHQCTAEMVGCRSTETPGVKECVSCCTLDYCNEPVPTNHTTAIRYSSFSSASSFFARAWILAQTCISIAVTLFVIQTDLRH